MNAPAPKPPSVPVDAHAFRERIMPVSDAPALVAIATIPTGPILGPLVLLPNAGIVHRVGPHRLHVRLARALARAGLPTIRFDLHGVGDSPPSREALGHEAQGIADIGAVLGAAHGAGLTGEAGAALIGLCSGADLGYRAALAHPELRKLVLLDPYAYDTAAARVERMVRKLTDLRRWQNRLSRLNAPPKIGGDDTKDLGNDRPVPPRHTFVRDIVALTGRGTEILMRYSRFTEETLTRPAHAWRLFRNEEIEGRLRIEVDRTADHTYTALAAQGRLIEDLVSFMTGAENGLPADQERRAVFIDPV